jgi:hypothetical protein
MRAAGLKPELGVLLDLIGNFPRIQAEAAAKIDRGDAVEQCWPLKGLLPSDVGYEVARRACEGGDLVAQKIGGRWFAAKAEVASWLAATRRGER